MKKIIALLLVGVVCLLFVACDNNNENTETNNKVEISNEKMEAEKAIIGTWQRITEDGIIYTLTFNKEHIVSSTTAGKVSETINKWKYDEELDCYMMVRPDYIQNAGTFVSYCTIINDNDTQYLNYNGYKYERVENAQ